MFGRRGEIVWKKPGFVSGGGRRDFDTYLGFGLLLPIYLTSPIHTFGWEEQAFKPYGWFHESPTASAIPLSKEHGFALRAYLQGWCLPFFVVSGLLFLPFCCSGFNLALTIASGIVLLLTSSGLLYLALTRGRHRDIRLILGRHKWGSSDPATWHPNLLTWVVDPEEEFGVESFAVLAEQCIDDKEWSRAMWAARLCAALEDEQQGEELTAEIFSLPAVQKRLARVRSDPLQRKSAFGEVIPLMTWVSGDLDESIFEVTG